MNNSNKECLEGYQEGDEGDNENDFNYIKIKI